MASKRSLAVLLGMVACGGGGGTGGGPDGNTTKRDAAIDSPPVASTIHISGAATARSLSGTMPVAGVSIGAYQMGNDSTPVATATTDAMGKYTLTITTNGTALDGYVKASITGYKDTYLYPPRPLAADTDKGAINLLTTQNYDLLSTVAQGNQTAGNGLIGLIVVDAAQMPVAGATVSTTPASHPYRYDGTNGLPSSTATATQADGVAIAFNVPATGAVMVSATKAGSTFFAHAVTARADVFTTTLVGM